MSISLWPSIGNWSLPCQSHYVIEGSRVKRADRWSKVWIDMGRAAEARARDEYSGTSEPKPLAQAVPKPEPPPVAPKPVEPPP